MKIINILLEQAKVVNGTNCANCISTKNSEPESVESKDLNSQGGIDSVSKKELELAESADLITLPGKKNVEFKKHCNHPKIDQDVTEHMCCAYWSAEGTHRAFGEQKIGKK